MCRIFIRIAFQIWFQSIFLLYEISYTILKTYFITVKFFLYQVYQLHYYYIHLIFVMMTSIQEGFFLLYLLLIIVLLMITV